MYELEFVRGGGLKSFISRRGLTPQLREYASPPHKKKLVPQEFKKSSFLPRLFEGEYDPWLQICILLNVKYKIYIEKI